MNPRRLSTAFLVALIISGLCTWVFGRKVTSRAAERVPDVKYVATVKSVQPGDFLKQENLQFISWPGTNPVPGAFTKLEDLVGRAAIYPIDGGQPITEKLLAAVGSGIGLAGKIPDGMRAIALRSDEVMGVAGFLFPGSRLDVLVTYRTDKSPDPVTLTVLQNSEVLAAGQKIQPDPEGKPATVTVVTLLLSSADAQKAVLASTQGAIHFVLRNGGDKIEAHDSPISLAELGGGHADSQVKYPPNPHTTVIVHRQEHSSTTVETIAGDKSTTDTFSGVQ